MENKETKLCKHCQTEIPKKAKVCPNCRKKQGMGCLPIVLIVIVILVVLAVMGSGGDNDTGTSSKSNQTETTSASKDASEEQSDDKDSEDSNVVKKGKSFEANGLKVTVDDIDTDYEPDDEYGLYELEDGMKYISTTFTFENTGDNDAYVSIYDFDCYADNSKCEQKYIGDDDFINTNLSSGRNVKFTTYYAVPKDSESIELEYTSNIWTDEKVIVKVK